MVIRCVIIENSLKLFMIFFLTVILSTSFALADNMDERSKLLAEAEEPFSRGEYEKAIKIFDEVLEIYPTDSRIHELKGLALSNLRLESTLAMQPQQNTSSRDSSTLNRLSMLEFYKALEINPNSVLALNGMALGFGNFGEYSEAEHYFKKSLEIEPNNEITQNYIVSLEKLREKYSLDVFENPTKKPAFLQMIEEHTIPYWIKNNAGWWADNKISDDDFTSGIEYMIENNIIKVSTQTNSELVQKELERKSWNFGQYLKNIQNDIKNQNRYVENINPSEYVIIKYWKDYHKWNLEQFLNRPDVFPDRTIIRDQDDNYVIKYKIYINEQPAGLPIDHVSTLESSFNVWERTIFDTVDGKKAIVLFDVINSKAEANVWVTWVVRNLGEGVLGHANLGKGVAEVAIGGYGCDGSFQLFSTNTVEEIMTHELGHSLGFAHSDSPDRIMYPTISKMDYAYCLLN